jgi:hypothetical protein
MNKRYTIYVYSYVEPLLGYPHYREEPYFTSDNLSDVINYGINVTKEFDNRRVVITDKNNNAIIYPEKLNKFYLPID